MPAGENNVLGDFNTRVGSREVVGDQWSKVRVHMAVESRTMQGRSYLASSLPSRQMYVIQGSGRRTYT